MLDPMHVFLSVALIHAVSVASPGPDFFLTMRNTLLGGRRGGIQTSLGIMVAVGLQISFCLTGLTLLLKTAPFFIDGLQTACGFYLLWLGWQAWNSSMGGSKLPGKSVEKSAIPTSAPEFSTHNFFLSGLLGNLMNAKAILFFFSLFSTVITESTPSLLKLACAGEILVANFIWFGFVAYAIGHPRLSALWSRYQGGLLRMTGVILWGLAIALLWPLGEWALGLIR